jgi:hypothetical protein
VASPIDRTHGRWPWLAAAGAVPATLAVARSEEPLLWAPLPAYFWHQTEEWVWPGGFLPWVNREVLGSDDDEYPITRRLGCAINTGGGWGLAALAGLRGGGRRLSGRPCTRCSLPTPSSTSGSRRGRGAIAPGW